MAANNESLSNVSGICNQSAINDSSCSSMYNQDSSNSSDHTNDKLVDLNERNLAISSMGATQIDPFSSRSKVETNKLKDIELANEFEAANYQAARELNEQLIQDYMMQNYLYNDYKSLDDTKSMTSIMTSMSTRKTFDLLSKVLPVLVFLLIVFLMIHFILFVRDVAFFNQLTEIICIALACVVFTLSSAFIVKIFCDSKHAAASWTNPPLEDYPTYPTNLTNSYVYNNGMLEPVIDYRTNLAQQAINQQPQMNVKRMNMINAHRPGELDGRPYCVDAIGNRVYNTQPSNQDKVKRCTQIDSPLNQLNQQSINQQHRRNSSFSQRSLNVVRLDDKKSNQYEQSIQTINLNLNGERLENPIKETST